MNSPRVIMMMVVLFSEGSPDCNFSVCVCVRGMVMRSAENVNVLVLSPGWEYSSENILDGFSHLPHGTGLNVHEECHQPFVSNSSFLSASTSVSLLQTEKMTLSSFYN